ncbi:hypothetical protein F4775DRAFT_551974 [Biscogniauxia sp. FL1348]|nr:hypothetical protein F4775DRAFT_551974 [Biscogniauxia sp. FL1348]
MSNQHRIQLWSFLSLNTLIILAMGMMKKRTRQVPVRRVRRRTLMLALWSIRDCPLRSYIAECGLEFNCEWDLIEHRRSPHARGHCIADQNPFKCKCSHEFTRLFTLERHIKSFEKSMPEHPCDECDTYRGEKGFSRKEHLVQHLRVFHKYSPAQLEARFPPRKSRVLAVSVCHIKTCEYYRDDNFQDLGWQEKERTRPFPRQSDYTAHMKKDHDWSPHPCDFPGCKKVDGKGFFSRTALAKHRDEQHPGMPPLELTPRIVQRVKCDRCHRRLRPTSLLDHRIFCREA